MAASIQDSATIDSALRAALLKTRNPDGGWGYRAQTRSRIEPTCWALLSLGHNTGRQPDTSVLGRWPKHDQWFIDVAGAAPNYAFNAIAALTLLQTPATAAVADVTIDGLVSVKGAWAFPSRLLRQNNSLRAWSWVQGTFSWVEPTAWCLLLLKHRLRYGRIAGAKKRIHVAEQMLFDRECQPGGWNYGNAYVYGRALPAYVPTTALTLLALQDRRDAPSINRALEELQKDVLREPSSLAVALTLICLRVYGLATDTCQRMLVELMSEHRENTQTDNVMALAMALYAVTNRRPAAFELPKRA